MFYFQTKIKTYMQIKLKIGCKYANQGKDRL